MIGHLKQFLRAPKVIVGELVALALICSLGAAVPQIGSATSAELARLREAGPVVTKLVQWFSLDHIFRSPWFLAATALASASLLLVVIEQLKRLRLQWSQPLTEAHFRSAPFRAEFERPAPVGRTPCLPPSSPSKELHVWTQRRIGLLGSPLFHIGVLFVIIAGALRALFGTEAVVDLMEGETLPPTASAWAAQFPGILGKPFHLDQPVTLNAVRAAHYHDGDLRDLKVQLSVPGRRGGDSAEIAVNHDLKTKLGRLFLGSDFGPAALVEWQSSGAELKHEAALLEEQGKGNFEGTSLGPNGLCAHLRAHIGTGGAHPAWVELRVMRGGALLFTGDARVGQTVALHTGERLVLQGTPFWARLRGSRDSALWLVYTGFALLIAGATMIFGVVKLDWCVSVTPLGERERVFVALKPQRFAPLFGERFERLVGEQRSAGIQPSEPQVQPAGATPAARCLRASAPEAVTVPALLLLALLLPGCHRASFEEARKLVENYNQVVSEAYRRGDIKLVDSVVGPNEGKKLTGLIGVRLDLGITLDSQLLSLEVIGVEKAKAEMRVQTKERWRYRDRKIGTGEQVGEESLDSYEMLYVFRKADKVWLVDEIKFNSPPQVGRKQTAWAANPEPVHGISKQPAEKEGAKP